MSCFQILAVFIIAQCYGHPTHLLKGYGIEHNGKPFKVMAHIHGKWTPFAEIEKKSLIQKRDLESAIIPPSDEKLPAPVIEAVQEKINVESKPFLVPSFNRIPLTRSVEPQLLTNIQESPPELNTAQIQTNVMTQGISEIFGGLPPRPVEPIPAEPIAGPIIVPPTNPAVPPLPVQTPEEVPPPALFDRTRMRKYAVYAGDVVLKYLSQFFNRARLTYNLFTSPTPPTPVFEN